MGLAKNRPLFTVDQYLAIERASPERHEYIDGVIYAMAGESPNHGIISVNLVAILHPQLKGTPCFALTKDTKVRSGPESTSRNVTRGMFSYPDLVVVCGELQFHDDKKDVILNPRVIIEVLSPSTEAFDRGDNCERYQTWNPSLTDYVIVSQTQPVVERLTRQADGGWSHYRASGLNAVVPLPSIQCELPLSDVYDRIEFANDSVGQVD
jgi:Uma2 family endonuclease